MTKGFCDTLSTDYQKSINILDIYKKPVKVKQEFYQLVRVNFKSMEWVKVNSIIKRLGKCINGGFS